MVFKNGPGYEKEVGGVGRLRSKLRLRFRYNPEVVEGDTRVGSGLGSGSGPSTEETLIEVNEALVLVLWFLYNPEVEGDNRLGSGLGSGSGPSSPETEVNVRIEDNEALVS